MIRQLLLGLMLFAVPAIGQDLSQVPETRLVPVHTDVIWVQLARVTQPVERAAQNAVVLDFSMGNGTGSRGSGVYLGDRYVATAYHVPEGCNERGTVTFRDGSKIGCIVNGKDTAWDQCIVTLDREHPTLPGVEIATSDPAIGQQVYSVGFGQGFRIFGGAVTHYSGSNRAPGFNWFAHQSPAVSGDSGGPMFDQTGKLLGCLWGAGGGETVGTKTSQFRLFVKPLFPRLAQWRANRIGGQIAGVQFGGGECPTCPLQPDQGQGGACPPGVTCPPQDYDGGGVGTYPQPIPDDQPDMELVGPQGPAGPQGPKGDKGDAGKDAEMTENHLAIAVAAVLEKLKDNPDLKGPKGDKGDVGERGPQGPPGVGITPEDIAALKADILASIKHPDIRVVVGENGKIIDDETYKPGEPIVLDIAALIKAANAK